MMPVNRGQMLAEAWHHVMCMSEDPYRASSYLLSEMFGHGRQTYREHLHRPIINAYGEEVPRIAIVRENLRRLGKIRLNPARIP